MSLKLETPPAESAASSLTSGQRIFVIVLFLIAFVISLVVILFLDPPAAHLSYLLPYGTHSYLNGACRA
jgi:hypothetical protein